MGKTHIHRHAMQAAMLGLISRNLRELRKHGLNGADLLTLEKVAILAQKGAGIVRTVQVGQMLGIGRSGAHARLARLVQLRVLVRVGRCVVLNVRGLLAIAADAAKARAERVNSWIHWTKRPKRSQGREPYTAETEKGCETGAADLSRSPDPLPDGRKALGFRLYGLIPVPDWA